MDNIRNNRRKNIEGMENTENIVNTENAENKVIVTIDRAGNANGTIQGYETGLLGALSMIVHNYIDMGMDKEKIINAIHIGFNETMYAKVFCKESNDNADNTDNIDTIVSEILLARLLQDLF